MILHLMFQFSSVAQSSPNLCNPVDYSPPASLSITNSQSLLKLMSIKSVMPYNHLIFCRPLLLPSIFPLHFKNYILITWNSLEVISAYFMIKQNFCLEWLIYLWMVWFLGLHSRGSLHVNMKVLCMHACSVTQSCPTLWDSRNWGEEPRWRRNRTGRPLSLLQIHRKNNWTLNKFHKTTSDR